MGKTNRKNAPREGTHSFNMYVRPNKKALIEAIEQNGACDPNKCWHKVSIIAILRKWQSETRLDWVRVDAGHVKIRYKGWWYLADQARSAKESLLLFDIASQAPAPERQKKYDLLQPRPYTLNFRRQNKVSKKPDAEARERLDKLNAHDNDAEENARRKRADYKKDMHLRVVGYAMI